MRIGVIGGGIAGLVAAYDLATAGHSVTLYERGARLGGLAGSFSIGENQSIEKYYHFICAPDEPYFDMQRELGLDTRMRWVTTQMGFFYQGKTHDFGDPLSLLLFPEMSLADKLSFAMASMRSKRRKATEWSDLENISARDWLVQEYGERTYNMLYEPLLVSKFGDYTDMISAAWMWARLYRVGNSRTLTQKERLGYLEGGSQAYIDALEAAIRRLGVDVRTSTPVEEVIANSEHAMGICVNGELIPFDYILSTVPIPHTSQLFRGIDSPYFDNLRQLEYFGVMVMLLRLKKRFSKYFWMNLSDPRLTLSGIIEYTNLNPYHELGGDTIVYLPQYLGHTDPRFNVTNEELLDDYCEQLKAVNPAFDPSWIVDYWVHRDRFAQPICQVGFSRHIPSIQTPIRNLLLTDSYQLHPHDRSISDSTALGRDAARLILSNQADGEMRPIELDRASALREPEARIPVGDVAIARTP